MGQMGTLPTAQMGEYAGQTQLENEISEISVTEETVSEQETPSEKAPLFQAIGTLYGVPQRDEEGRFSIEVGGRRYYLFIPGDRYRAWLKRYETYPEQPLYLRVYPKYLSLPNREPTVSFQVAAWEDKPLEQESELFRFRGIWQFVPQIRIPVISIYRNRGVSDPKGKFKATHLPVLMRRSDGVNPFRFNPRAVKEDLPKRYFIQAIFKFIPSRNCWGWVEDIEPPTESIPKYEKPVKAVPTDNQQAVRRTGTGSGKIIKSVGSKKVNQEVSVSGLAEGKHGAKPKPLISRNL